MQPIVNKSCQETIYKASHSYYNLTSIINSSSVWIRATSLVACYISLSTILCHHPIKRRDTLVHAYSFHQKLQLSYSSGQLLLAWPVIQFSNITTVTFIDIKPLSSTVSISVSGTIAHAILAIAMLLYPLCGFVADVCFGRLKAVIISLCSILTFAIIVYFTEILVLAVLAIARCKSRKIAMILSWEDFT